MGRKQTMWFLLFLAIFFVGIVADDWPAWRGTAGDGISRDKGISNSWPAAGPKEVWRIPGGTGYSAVSVAERVAYILVGDNQYQYCLAVEEDSGRTIWKKTIGHVYKNSIGDGPRSTPLIDNKKVYCISAFGDIWSLDATNGKTIWNFNILNKFDSNNMGWGTCSSPAMYKDYLLFNTGARSDKSIVALNKNTGETVWTSQDARSSYSSPIVVTGEIPQVIFFTDDGVMSIRPENGNLLWSFPHKSRGANAVSPIYWDNMVYVSSSYAVGSTLIRLIPEKNGFEAVEEWKSFKIKNHFASSVLWQGYLYGFNEHVLTCMEFKTGDIKWRQRGLGKGSLIGTDQGYMFILSDRGILVLAQMDPEKYIEKARTQVFLGTTCYTVPSLANGKLFLRNMQEIVCLDISEG